MSDTYDEAGELQWILSSPTSYAAPVEFTVGSSQWSLQSISDTRSQRSPITPVQIILPVTANPQWTFQHVDSTFRNTIVMPRSTTTSDVSTCPVVTAFPISRSSSMSSGKQRPRIVIESPPLVACNLPAIEISGSTTPMFPPRDKTRDFDSPMFGLFQTLLPLSPALSLGQSKLVPPPAWLPLRSPSTPVSHLMPPPPSAISGSATPTPRSILTATALSRLVPTVDSDSSDSEPEPEETPLLRQTLDSLDGRLRDLLEERMHVQTRLMRAASKRSPISRLPVEILARIFELGTNGTGTGGFDFGIDSIPEIGGLFFDVVSRVCILWKEVVESTPTLWSTITIDSHNSFQNTQMRLERSRSVPIDIQIILPDRLAFARNNSTGGGLANTLKILKPHMSRWRTLRVQVPSHTHAQVVLECCAGSSAPLLEAFSVQIGQSRAEGSEKFLPWLFDKTSMLRQLSLTSARVNWDVTRFNSLTSLYLSDYGVVRAPSTQQLLDILDKCSSTLTNLTIRNISECDTDGEMQMLEDLRYYPRVVLSCLKRATFYFVGSSRLSLIMSRLALPVLEQLELSYLDDVSVTLEMLCQQKADHLPLKTLRIHSSLVSEDWLVQLLERLPELNSLELADCEDITSYLLNEFSNPHDWLCPKLGILCVDGCTAVDSLSVRAFVTSRLPSQQHATQKMKTGLHPVPVHELHISRCLGISSDTVQWLRMYVPVVHREF